MNYLENKESIREIKFHLCNKIIKIIVNKEILVGQSFKNVKRIKNKDIFAHFHQVQKFYMKNKDYLKNIK